MKINEPITNNEVKMSDDQILVSRTDLKGAITYCNDAFVEMSGFSRDELIGKNHNIVRHPHMPAEAFEWLWQDIKTGKPWIAMVKNRRKNGDFYWVEANVTPVYKQGKIVEYLSVRQKPTEQQIAEAEALYAKVNAGEVSLLEQTLLQKINVFSKMSLAAKLSAQVGSLLLIVFWLLFVQFSGSQMSGMTEIALAVIASALALSSFGLIGGVVKALKYANDVFSQLAEGNFKNTVKITRFDEVGDVFRGLFKVQTKLNSDLDRERELSAANSRIKIALDNVSSNVMMADNNRNIIYMNKSVTEMFRNAESDLKKDLPQFNASALMGFNIDGFHKNPAHQAKLLDTFTSTYQSEIVVGGRTMSIVANPVIDEGGNRLGSVVEWQDRTIEVAIEQEIEQLVQACQIGDLSERLALEGKSGFNAKLAEKLNAMLDVLNNAFNDVNSVMSTLATGDLQQVIEADYQGVYGEVKNNVNATILQLRDIISELRSATDDILSSSNEIASGNSNLSSRTEQQAAALEQTAASMEELTSTVKQNADNAQKADQLAVATKAEAEKGGEVVGDAVNAMNEISQSSNKIADIIGVIDEIAFQTNLLALNASVEAARAGEQGRGFAVVATEVRNLAQRSATAAKEIKDLIQDSVAKVESGSALVNESGETLQSIIKGILEVGDTVAEISSASHEQSEGIEQVNHAVNSMDSLTQQNAALAEEASASSMSMSERANKMAQKMKFFKL